MFGHGRTFSWASFRPFVHAEGARDAPPGPAAPPAVQTLNWLFRPIEFMNSCRRRHGDAFSVSFLGFKTPMVMMSDPEAIRALYRGRENGLPPGRSVTLEPVVGPRSVLLLEGGEHLARRRLMLPAFHGERMRAYEAIIDASSPHARSTPGPLGEAFAIHPRMQALTLEVILRAVFGVSDPGRVASAAGAARPTCSPRPPRRSCSCGSCSPAASAGRDPLAALKRRNAEVDELLAPPRSPSGAPTRTSTSARTSSRCSSPPASRTASR